MLASGELRRLVDEDGIVGLTSNPTIFQRSIGQGALYDDDIAADARRGADALAIYETLAVGDIQAVADVLRPVYDRTGGADGLVSLEVSPELAADAAGTVAEARRLWARVARPNLFVKVPATREALPAITALLAEGINVNVTLIFGIGRYREVIAAYLEGMERAAASGRPIERLASVASFFVSRVDVHVDRRIDALLVQADDERRGALGAIRGRAAIANACLAYMAFTEAFSGERWRLLLARGARPQRPLWASTGTKDPRYSDVRYVEELIAPDTVTTMPLETIAAFRDHGRARASCVESLGEAGPVMRALARFGIDMEAVSRELEEQGVRIFVESFRLLLASLHAKAGTARAVVASESR